VSVGAFDYVKDVIEANGRLDFWRVNMRPGKPLAIGEYRGLPFIGLPGNPVSVWSCLLTLASPFLRKCQGLTSFEPVPLTLRSDFNYTVKGNRLEFVRVRRNNNGGLDIYPTQDSAIISSAVWADGIAMIQAGTTVKPGDLLPFLPGPGWNS
jgi:molybdopterin molybdotransferase